MKKILIPFFSLFLFHSPFLSAAIVDGIVAIVDDKAITQSDIRQAKAAQKTKHLLPNAETVSNLNSQNIIHDMINQYILESEIEKQKISVSEAQVAEAINKVLSQNQLTQEQLEADLKKNGIPFNEYREKIRSDIRRQEFLQKTIYPKVRISDYDLQLEYQKKQSQYLGYEKVRFQEIFLSPESGSGIELANLAQKLVSQLKAGASFSKLATEYSKGAFAANGGDSGLLETSSLRPELAYLIEKLPLNKVSNPMPTPNGGIFIFRVTERKDPKPKSFNDVKEEIRQEYIQSKIKDEIENFVMQARSNHYIEIRK